MHVFDLGHHEQLPSVFSIKLIRSIQYRQAGYNKKSHSEHEAELLLHQSAKKAFDALGLKKLPSINMLKQEYAALLAEKKKLYQG